MTTDAMLTASALATAARTARLVAERSDLRPALEDFATDAALRAWTEGLDTVQGFDPTVDDESSALGVAQVALEVIRHGRT